MASIISGKDLSLQIRGEISTETKAFEEKYGRLPGLAVVIVGDEATLKRVYYYPEEEKLILSPENPKYAPLVYIGEELSSVKILGKAVAFQSRVS